mgnify:CR=1 FL=1|jgi:hypothetical protein
MKKPIKVVGKYIYTTESEGEKPEHDTSHTDDLPERLGFNDLAKNLRSSLLHLYTSGQPVVTALEWDYRIMQCRSCEYWIETPTKLARCTKCGCSSGKLLLKTNHCPLPTPKW